jgi:hypothetical protein
LDISFILFYFEASFKPKNNMQTLSVTEQMLLDSALSSREWLIEKLIKDWETKEDETSVWLTKTYKEELEMVVNLRERLKNSTIKVEAQ